MTSAPSPASACSIAFAPASHVASRMSRASTSGTAARSSQRFELVTEVRERVRVRRDRQLERSEQRGVEQDGEHARRRPAARRRPSRSPTSASTNASGSRGARSAARAARAEPLVDRAAAALDEPVGVEDDDRPRLEAQVALGVLGPDVDAERKPALALEEPRLARRGSTTSGGGCPAEVSVTASVSGSSAR